MGESYLGKILYEDPKGAKNPAGSQNQKQIDDPRTDRRALWLGLVDCLHRSALVYFVLAIGFDGRWSRFFWAVGIGAVAKWLSKGFQDQQIRVAFEAKKIAEGMSPEETGREWMERYLERK